MTDDERKAADAAQEAYRRGQWCQTPYIQDRITKGSIRSALWLQKVLVQPKASSGRKDS